MRTLIEQWAPRRGYLRRQLPLTSDSWSSESSIVAQYIRHLETLGLVDPTDASHFYEQALKLREAYHEAAARSLHVEPDLSARLASGEISAAEASKQLAKAPTEQEISEKRQRERSMISNAVRSSYAMSVRAVHNYGEENWLGLLRPLVLQAYEDQDQARWDALHRFAGLLRNPDLAGLGYIAMAPNSVTEFDETWRYTVGRPELYHHWRRDHAELAQNIAIVHVGSTTYVAIAVTKGPHPTIADIDPSWEPGLYSAAEVLKLTDAILDQQQAAQIDTEIEVSQEGRSV
jgi:hypothetical protein